MSRSRGGKRWSETEARRLLASWEESGVTLTAFAKRRGYHPERLRRWKQKLSRKSEPASARLVPVEITGTVPGSREGTPSRIELELSLGVRLIAEAQTDPEIVARWVRALESRGC